MLPPEQHTRVLDPVVPANWLMGMVQTWLPWTIVALALVVYLVISGARRGKNGCNRSPGITLLKTMCCDANFHQNGPKFDPVNLQAFEIAVASPRERLRMGKHINHNKGI